jgi:hypothetical protein
MKVSSGLWPCLPINIPITQAKSSLGTDVHSCSNVTRKDHKSGSIIDCALVAVILRVDVVYGMRRNRMVGTVSGTYILQYAR